MVDPKDIDRFMVFVHEEPNTGCWLWGGGFRGKGGYGQFWLNGRDRVASRVSWMIHRGPVPDGLWVLHTCDNPPCVNPEHLFLGTNIDNIRDRQRKGRPGPNAILTESDAREILRRTRAGESKASVARDYGVVRATASGIFHGKDWKHIQ